MITPPSPAIPSIARADIVQNLRMSMASTSTESAGSNHTYKLSRDIQLQNVGVRSFDQNGTIPYSAWEKRVLTIIILLLVVIIAIMLFGPAAIIAAVGTVVLYFAVVGVAALFAIPLTSFFGEDALMYGLGVLAVALVVYALWNTDRKRATSDVAAQRSFASAPPTSERRAQLKRDYRQSQSVQLIDDYLSEVDVAPDNTADHKPTVTVQKDRPIGRVGGERLKSLHGVSMKDLVGRLAPERKDVEPPRD